MILFMVPKERICSFRCYANLDEWLFLRKTRLCSLYLFVKFQHDEVSHRDVYRAGVNKSRATGSQLSLIFWLWTLIFVGPQYETCLVSQIWRLEFLDGSFIFGKFVNDWCRGVVVYLHSFLTSTLDGVVSCSLLTAAAALFPRDAAPDNP